MPIAKAFELHQLQQIIHSLLVVYLELSDLKRATGRCGLCEHVCLYVYVCVSVCARVCLYVHMRVCACVSACVWMYVRNTLP